MKQLYSTFILIITSSPVLFSITTVWPRCLYLSTFAIISFSIVQLKVGHVFWLSLVYVELITSFLHRLHSALSPGDKVYWKYLPLLAWIFLVRSRLPYASLNVNAFETSFSIWIFAVASANRLQTTLVVSGKSLHIHWVFPFCLSLLKANYA